MLKFLSSILNVFYLCLIFFSIESRALTIVFSNDGHTNPYHVEWLSGFDAALKSYNKAFGNINGYWLSASRIEQQYQQLEQEIKNGVDILFINAMSVEAIMPLVDIARKKGVIVVGVHNYLKNADYNFLLGDEENGYKQGLALATYFNGEAKIGIMLGMRGNTSGEARHQGILRALKKFPDIKIIVQEPADWNISKSVMIADKWFKMHPDLDALSVVTDSYLYPAIQIADELNLKNIVYFGYDGDKKILEMMKNNGPVKADILLSATREGWSFVQLAYKISRNQIVPKIYNFHTPLVLTKETHQRCLKNGFPKDIQVYYVDKALKLANDGYLEFGPKSVSHLK